MAKTIVYKKFKFHELRNELLQRGELLTRKPNIVTQSEDILSQEMLKCHVEFVPQFTIKGRCFDFKIYHYPVLVEIDGEIHNSPQKRINDYRKDRYVQRRGYKVLRFSNDEVKENVKRVVWEIRTTVKYSGFQPIETYLYPLSVWEQIKMWLGILKPEGDDLNGCACKTE